MNKKLALLTGLVAAFPLVAAAQNAQSILSTIANLVNQLIPLMMAIALLVFFWGLVKYIWNSGSEDAKEEGKNVMIAGIVGLFVMVSIWGIVGIIANTFGVQTGGTQSPPRVNSR